MLITSPQNPRIKAVAKLLESRHRRKTGLFLVEREREITRALAAGFVLTELYWYPRRWPQDWSPQGAFGLNEHQVIEVSDSVLAKMTVSENPQGAVGVFEHRSTTVDELFLKTPEKPGLWLVTVGIEKPGNLGAMARTAESAGCSGMLVCTNSQTHGADLYNPNAIRSSTGAIFSLPMADVPEDQAITLLKAGGIQIVTTSDRAQMRWDKVDFAADTAIVIGPEDTGLPQS
ncbi:MAG TPA: 23S rRNA methyltransferase, partial [Phycisphaerales bacterium]|nr:23S rRNA methyltransferase [Phycisphaerales bacterium]